MHPITVMVQAAVRAVTDEGQITEVREHLGERHLVIEVQAASTRAAGLVIGKHGETITAIRHVATRGGKKYRPVLNVSVEVVTKEEGV